MSKDKSPTMRSTTTDTTARTLSPLQRRTMKTALTISPPVAPGSTFTAEKPDPGESLGFKKSHPQSIGAHQPPPA